ncbi:hypothetical protein ACH54D_02500 [Atlantibacter hermannii]|uniref:hypothetical protein n=1 Tax=Atlantibacter hermannii TaxID=565 RepID=UPI0037BB370E
MENTSDTLPRIQIKRKLESIMADDWKLKVVDQFKSGVKQEVQTWVVGLTESFQPIQLNSKSLIATLTVDVVVFSEINETGVHHVISKLMDLTPSLFTDEIRINSINPVSSDTSYIDEASDGHVMASVTLEFSYYYKRN